MGSFQGYVAGYVSGNAATAAQQFDILMRIAIWCKSLSNGLHFAKKGLFEQNRENYAKKCL
jgi:hypothetical protein